MAEAGARRPFFRHDSYSSTDRKSTRLNSSHSQISYAVFCLKKKNKALLQLYHYTPVEVHPTPDALAATLTNNSQYDLQTPLNLTWQLATTIHRPRLTQHSY